MAKPELGLKRVCVACGAKFYDLTKTPAICPKCGTEQPLEQPRPRRTGGNVLEDKRPKKIAAVEDGDADVEVEADAEEAEDGCWKTPPTLRTMRMPSAATSKWSPIARKATGANSAPPCLWRAQGSCLLVRPGTRPYLSPMRLTGYFATLLPACRLRALQPAMPQRRWRWCLPPRLP